MKEYKTRAATIILRPDDIVEFFENEDWNEPNDIKNATETVTLARKVIDGKCRAYLVNVPRQYIPKEVLEVYQKFDIGDVARALLVTSFATKIVGNLYLKLAKGKPTELGRVVTTKLFVNKAEAVKWLLEEIEKAKKLY